MLCFAATASAAPAETGNFEQALNSKKPLIIIMTASWASNSTEVASNVAALKRTYGERANIMSLDISDEQTKFYNKYFAIQPNLPNAMFFKDKGKISRFIPNECTVDYACTSKRASMFIN